MVTSSKWPPTWPWPASMLCKCGGGFFHSTQFKKTFSDASPFTALAIKAGETRVFVCVCVCVVKVL